MNIIYGPKFCREYKKLSNDIKDIAEGNFLIFEDNPFDFRLKTHKLSGKLKGLYSFSIGRKNRIIFEFSSNKKDVYFHSVGNHDIYNL